VAACNDSMPGGFCHDVPSKCRSLAQVDLVRDLQSERADVGPPDRPTGFFAFPPKISGSSGQATEQAQEMAEVQRALSPKSKKRSTLRREYLCIAERP